MKSHICRTCGTQQEEPYLRSPSSFGAELVVLLISGLLALIFSWAFLIFAAVFSGWRHFAIRPGVCEKCKSADVIPADTPIGRQLAEQFKVPDAPKIPAPSGDFGRSVGRALAKLIRKLI